MTRENSPEFHLHDNMSAPYGGQAVVLQYRACDLKKCPGLRADNACAHNMTGRVQLCTEIDLLALAEFLKNYVEETHVRHK